MRVQERFTHKVAISAAVLAVTMLGFTARSAHAGSAGPGQIQNPISNFPIEADGAYTNAGEWSDIRPAWFVSNGVSGATPTFQGDPNANSLLFAGLSRDTPTSTPELYLMYDYLPRTSGPTAPGEFLGNVSFPVDVPVVGSGGLVTSHSTNITVQLQTTASFPAPSAFTHSFFDVFVDFHDGNGLQLDGPNGSPATALGLEAGVGPGLTPVNPLWGITASSPFHNTLHELLELGVPLDIPAGFGAAGGPFDPKGSGGGNGYSPLPAFWGSNLPKNPGDPDPPASGGLFQILPDGSTTILPIHIPAPEPTTLGLLGLGGMLLGIRRRGRGIR